MQIAGDYRTLTIDITRDESGKKISEILRTDAGLSRRLLVKLKQNKSIFLNGKSSSVSRLVYENDELSIDISERGDIKGEELDINIIYEDIDVCVIDKKPKVLVHPTKHHENNTLLNALIYYANNNGEEYKPHIVNRLDRDTSGLMIIAKNSYAHYELMKQMAQQSLSKKYLAIAKGGFDKDSGILEYKISDKNEDGIERIVREDGKKCKTIYRVLRDDGNFALVELELITGRTHQIRVHMAEIGHSLFGDNLYGSSNVVEYNKLCEKDKCSGDITENKCINRQALHSYKLRFKSPRGKFVEIESELPEDMKSLLK